MITPRGEVLQRETAQTIVYTDNDCETRTFELMMARHSSGNTCDEVRESMKKKALKDAWGAQVRVICNGVNAQAISAGRDGTIGTCDDLSGNFSMGAVTFSMPLKTADGDGSKEGSDAREIEVMTVEHCGVGFEGQISVPAGEILQRETSQTRACPGDECPGKALGMISLAYHRAKTCAEVREKLLAKPIVDAWGAQARVTCNGDLIQSLSAGRDGKLGTCDDLAHFNSFVVRH